MSVANFWIDKLKNCKNPGQAIAYLQDAKSPNYLSNAAYQAGVPMTARPGVIGKTVQLPPQYALLMMGITEKLQEALAADYANGNGIGYVELTQAFDQMRIWFVRRDAGTETKSVVIIASWKDYWDSGALPHYNWSDLCTTPYENNSPPNYTHPLGNSAYGSAIDFNALIRYLLPRAHKKHAWW